MVDTVSLSGDIVIFSGATLTINPGTIIEFAPGSDRHQFSKEGVDSSDDLIEIFVYGTLTTGASTEGWTVADSILFQRNDPAGSGEAWGGIHVMAGGTATLNSYTRISDTRRGKPTDLTAEPVDGQVGHIELTWTNPDDSSIPQWEYQQKAGSADWGPWMPMPGSTSSTSSHIVEGLTIGVSYQFKVRGLNRTDLAESDPSAAVTAAGPPEPPELTVVAGHEKVRLRWSPGANNGSEITGHKWRYKAGAAAWDPDWTGYATPEQIIQNLANDTTYTFQMQSKNGVGYSEVVEVQATPRNPIEGPTSISFTENSDDPVASYRFAPAELDQSLVAYRLHLSDVSGFDSGLFELNSGELRFQNAPDFETPADTDGDNIYTVRLRAAPVSGNGGPVRRTVPPLPFTKQVEVTVTDADDPGVIALSPLPPQVGVPFTAELTDQDGGITGANWQWQGQEPGTTMWTPLSTASGTTQSSYTPQVAQVGWTLRAVVNPYSDVFGAGKTAQSDPTAPVQVGVPTAPENLRPLAGDQSVQLTWEAPLSDGGSPITGYTYRYSPDGGTTWLPSADGTTVDETTPPYVRDTINELINGTEYTFEVWANNDQGAGAVAEEKATPGVVPPVPTDGLSATAGLNQITVSWDEVSAVPAVTGYKLQYRSAIVGTENWSDYLPATTTGPRKLSYTHRQYGTVSVKYRFQYQVQAVNAIGEGAWSESFPAAGAIPLPGHTTALDSMAVDNENVTVRWECPNYGWCVPLDGALVAPLRLQSRRKSGSAVWTGWVGVPSSQQTTVTHSVSTLNQALVHQFQTRAVNANGEPGFGSESAVVVPLQAQVGDGTVQLAWGASGRSVDGWQYQFKAGSGSWGAWQGVPASDGARLSHEVPNLMNGVRYQFQVRAMYRGKVKVVSFIRSATLVGRLSLMASGGDGQVGLRWTAPDHSATIADYQVRQRVSDSGQDWSSWAMVPGSSTARDTTVTGLTNGATYQFQVQAIDSQGTSVAVSDIESATPAAVPDAPPHFMPFPGDGQVVLEWEAAANNGSRITHYEVQSRQVSDPAQAWSSWSPVSGGRSARDTTMTGLTNGQRYEFAVRAVNGVGNGASIAQSAMPRALSLTASGGDGQVALRWTFSAHSATIADYQVRQRVSASGQDWSLWATVSGGTTVRDTTVMGLTNGETYQFQVQALDSQGTSVSVSNIVSATPQANFSFVPPRVMLNATVGLQFIFNRPNPINGTGTSTYATTSTGGGLTATLTGISGTPTTAGSYDFTWTATDGAGNTAIFTLTLTVTPLVETQYAYRAWQTAPLFDAVASGPPDNWSSSEIPWTDAAPRVWRIGRTRPSGGIWSEWGTLEKHSERPAASETFYRRASSAPSTPGTQTGRTLSTPSAWQTTQPTATATESVWSTTANRAAGEIQWIFTAPTQETPITSDPETQYAYRAWQTAPLFDAVASGPPDNWSSSEIPWTDAAPRVWSIQRTRPSGGTWSEWGTLKKHSERPAASETFYQRASSAPSTPGTQTGRTLSTPSTWQTTQPTATATESVWSTTANRAAGDRQWIFTAPTQETPITSVSAPGPVRNLSAEGGSVSGSIAVSWDAPNTGGTPDRYRVESRQGSAAWQAGGTTTQTSLSIGDLVGGSNYSIQVRAENSGGNSRWRSTTATATNGTETESAYRLHTSGTTAPTFSASAGSVPSGWSSSRQTPTSTYAPYEWQISRTRPTDGSWSSWGSATVFSTYTERQTAYRLHISGTMAPTFSASASSVPSGWSSSRQTPTSTYAPYEWQISRTRPTDGSWSSWGSATVFSTYTERQTAYRLHISGTMAPTFSASASSVPSGWSSSRQTPTSTYAPYEWQISRTRPTDGSWSNWGSITVFSTYTETQTAYRLNNLGSNPPTFSTTASGVPSGWSSSRLTPSSSNRYEWRISRTRPTDGSWSNWGSITVVSTYTETQTAYRLNNLGSNPPTFSASASGVPSGWSSSRQTPSSSNRYEWRISRTRPTDGSWSNWGRITVFSTYTETQTAYRLHISGTTAPTFSASASSVPSGWSSSRQTPTSSSNRYEWQISRTRPTSGSWSNWGSATVVSTYTETQTAYRLNNLGSNPPTFSASASGVPSGWSSSRQTPTSSNRYEWRISRTRPTDGSWSNWGSITVVSTYTETQTAYRLNNLGSNPPTFSASASGVPSGWSSSRQTPSSSNRYEWRISRTRPTDGSWSNWGSRTVVSTYTETQTAYRLNNLGSNPPTFSASASGVPSGWSSSRQTPSSSNRYEWRISRTRPTDGSWSNWGSRTVVSTYTETQTAYRLNNLGSNPPTFSASASGVPSGWSSSRQTPSSSNRYEWRISRTRPTDGSWSNWGSRTVVSTYTETQTAYRLHISGTTAPTFSASASSVPTGWSSSRQTPTSAYAPYEWQISRTRPTDGSWSSWGSATVVSTYTERQTAYRLNNLGSNPPTFSASASGVPSGWSSSRQTPSSSNRYEWRISRTRPTDGSWSNWGSASVVSTYTETQTAYRLNNLGSNPPTFSASASGVPSGWSSSRQTPSSSNRYEWRISRTRPTDGSWSNWGSASVVSTYTETQTAYRLNNLGSNPPTFSASASSVPTGWSLLRQTPTSSNRYEWSINRTRPAGGSWSSWGSASVVSRYTERQTAYKRNDSGTTAPAFSSTASGTPYGWSSSQPSPTSSNRYVWSISRSRPAGGSWSSWGSASVVSRYTERQTAYKRNDSGTTAPAFSSTASGTPYGWSSSQPSPTSSNRYVWSISRTRPAGGSWSSWGSATVVSRYTERQTAYRLHTSGTTAPSFSATASGVPSGWSSTRPSPDPYARYVWQISRTRPTGGSWSNWGSATVVSTYTASRRNDSGATPPAFSTIASGVPSGGSWSRLTRAKAGGTASPRRQPSILWGPAPSLRPPIAG